MNDKPITLDHFLYGHIKVTRYHEATYWTGQREWHCEDRPELGPMTDGFFKETRAEIDAKVAASQPKAAS